MRRRALPFVSAIVSSCGIHVAAVLLLGPVESGVRVSEAEGLLVSLVPAAAVPGAEEASGADGGAAAKEAEAAGRKQLARISRRPSAGDADSPVPPFAAAAAEALDTPDPPRVRRATAVAAPERREATEEANEEVTEEVTAEVTEEAAAAEEAPPDAVDLPEPVPLRTTAAEIPLPNASPAIGRDGGGGRSSAVEDYHARLRVWLERHKRYPRRARRRREQGVVVLRFVVDRMGAVLDLEVEGTSGHPLLDAAALDMVRRAQPLPKMPSAMRESRAEHLLPVRFALR